MDVAELIRKLRDETPAYEAHHIVKYSNDAIKTAAVLAGRLPYRSGDAVETALDLID